MTGAPAKKPHVATRIASGPGCIAALPEEIQKMIVARLTPLDAARLGVASRGLSDKVSQAPQWRALLGENDADSTIQSPRLTVGARITGALYGRESRKVVHTRLGTARPPPLGELLRSDELFEAQLFDWQHEEARAGYQEAAVAAQRILQARASSATVLDLSGVLFSTLPPCIGRLTQLEKFYLGGCSALVSLPEAIGQLTRLQTLRLHGCAALVALPEAISQLVRLRKLYLSGCTSLAALPRAIRKLPQLTLNTLGCTSLVTPAEAVRQHAQWLDLLRAQSAPRAGE